jgi:integrase
MPRKELNDRFVATVRVTKRTNYFDTKELGLALRVSPSGARVWYFVYRINGRGSQWLTLGDYDTLSLAEARKKALHERSQVRVEKIDRAAVRRAEREAAKAPPPPAPTVFTFADLAALYGAFAKGTKKTWKADVSKVKRYLLPAWGTKPVREITRQHIHELLDTLTAKGMTIGVNRIQALISRMFTLALDRGHVDAHPAARMMKRFAERAGERTLTDDELRALWAGLDKRPGAAADALRLRLVLGQRGEETAGMLWSELDLSGALWELPGRRTKNGRRHAVPLPATALELLKARRQTVGKEEAHVFPGLTLFADDHRELSAIHGGAYEWKDLRRTVATRIGELGFDTTTVGRLLNHASATITDKHYNKAEYLAEKTAALAAWDRELQRIIRNQPKPRAAVVRMRRA